jgi:hypothetical protein
VATAVGGAPPGDPYLLPSLAAAVVLEGEGLGATNLGPETPLESLALAVEDVEASVVWLSVSVLQDRAALRRALGKLLPQLVDRGAVLVLGGQRAPELGLSENPSVYVGRSMAELAALIRGMKLASRSSTRST